MGKKSNKALRDCSEAKEYGDSKEIVKLRKDILGYTETRGKKKMSNTRYRSKSF